MALTAELRGRAPGLRVRPFAGDLRLEVAAVFAAVPLPRSHTFHLLGPLQDSNLTTMELAPQRHLVLELGNLDSRHYYFFADHRDCQFVHSPVLIGLQVSSLQVSELRGRQHPLYIQSEVPLDAIPSGQYLHPV